MITALEYERINYINDLMQELHSLNADVYESLCDREYEDTKIAIRNLQARLKSLNDSLNEEL